MGKKHPKLEPLMHGSVVELPGGRVAQKAWRIGPEHTASTAATAAPALRKAASMLPWERMVSASSATRSPSAGAASIIA